MMAKRKVTKIDTGWDYVATVDSMTAFGEAESYDLKRHRSTGRMACGCKSYQFSRGEKTCKHLQAWHETRSQLANLADADEPVVRTLPRRAKVGAETLTVHRRAITFGEIPL